uniref:Uncharacterized protein n=1 Tax=viral metagenome TaxID=1070528 RepID=A0A6C0I735_9ZZZZ
MVCQNAEQQGWNPATYYQPDWQRDTVTQSSNHSQHFPAHYSVSCPEASYSF